MTSLEEIAPPDDVDPEAPYGRKPDGTPYKRPAAWRLKSTAALMNRTPRAAPPKSGPKKKPAAGDPVDYRAAIVGLLAVPAAVLGMLGPVNPAYALDGIALQLAAPQIAEAANEAAQVDTRVANVLDRLLSVGPYGALMGALVPLAVQIAANHRVLPTEVAVTYGAMTPEELLTAHHEFHTGRVPADA